ncbi:MAG: peptidoglycan-associated lipoprotein Pal [Rugosibacter sp.]|nr:MAG: peptidoglycan-associated lipoprotein Pal [Rugosibacter sp.]TBR08146.1 MAG: peptidoglycan-associated lipoprotein Pal [Rugosibacter sp.]
MRHSLFAIVSACALLSACSTAPKEVAASATEPIAATSKYAKSSVMVETDIQRQDRMIKSLSDKSIFFDFDNYSIKTQYESVIKKDYEFLKSAPKVAVALQGNADERGSTEYNLALGQKRAEVVKHELKLLGVPEDKLEAVSYGEEKPRATCHEEKCWSENRRVDLVFLRQP